MFTSPVYWIFLFVSAAAFWILPRTHRFGFLALASIAYLGTLRPVDTAAFALLALIMHRLAFWTARIGNRAWLWLLIPPLLYLAFFKYALPVAQSQFEAGSFLTALAIPIGISYFTFKLIHFIIEVGRGNVQNRSLSQFGAYMFLFPMFTAGPIERFDHFLQRQSDRPRTEDVVIGGTRIIHGLIKRFVIVDLVLLPLLRGLPATEAVVEHLHLLPWYKVAAFVFGHFLLAYLDFSAYSDIAIGSCRLFGIKVVENFNWPILARNIQDFWKRWHISLVNWCQSYIFMPLIGKYRNPYLAVFITFIAIAFWHAASWNWLCWGLHHAVGLAVYMKWSRFRRARNWNLPSKGPLSWWSLPVTLAYVSSSAAYIVTDDLGIYPAFRLLARLAFVDLPEYGQ